MSFTEERQALLQARKVEEEALEQLKIKYIAAAIIMRALQHALYAQSAMLREEPPPSTVNQMLSGTIIYPLIHFQDEWNGDSEIWDGAPGNVYALAVYLGNRKRKGLLEAVKLANQSKLLAGLPRLKLCTTSEGQDFDFDVAFS